ncbi:hypothetical protein WICPIJ_001675 [Wickerhamomyces pijperi]|uniref:Uncharacterized protein n=1 Tax=Wickerhamomyces pijperi TaxID=599730 RepID=A0A9P8TQC6_WICPI|nr:hypothetical protein WICPIJ_001675 [Wickerhamomyces pijperi]
MNQLPISATGVQVSRALFRPLQRGDFVVMAFQFPEMPVVSDIPKSDNVVFMSRGKDIRIVLSPLQQVHRTAGLNARSLLLWFKDRGTVLIDPQIVQCDPKLTCKAKNPHT